MPNMSDVWNKVDNAIEAMRYGLVSKEHIESLLVGVATRPEFDYTQPGGMVHFPPGSEADMINPFKHRLRSRCPYCGNKHKEDSRGNCASCGAPV